MTYIVYIYKVKTQYPSAHDTHAKVYALSWGVHGIRYYFCCVVDVAPREPPRHPIASAIRFGLSVAWVMGCSTSQPVPVAPLHPDTARALTTHAATPSAAQAPSTTSTGAAQSAKVDIRLAKAL